MKIKLIFIAITILLTIFALPLQASAAGGIVDIEEFDNITSGDGQYLASDYRDNYNLDIIELGIMDSGDKMVNALANILFSFLRLLSYLTVVIFYHCFSFDIATLFGAQIGAIQAGLTNSIFRGLFPLAFGASAFFLGMQLLKRNIQGIFSELGKVIFIWVISFLVVTDSAFFLSFVNSMTKEISVQALGDMSGGGVSSSGDVNAYAAEASGILWGSLVHKPWVTLEFGDSYAPQEDKIEELLAAPPNSDTRLELIKKHNKDNGLFEKDVGGWRVGFIFLLLIPVVIKCAIYCCVAFFQICFQLLTLFYVLTCPVILLLAIAPTFGGLDLIKKWLLKILETQISILVLTFIIGLMISIDNLLFAQNSAYGWLIGLVIQVLVSVALILNRNKLFKALGGITRGIQNPQYALRQYMRSGNIYETADRMTHSHGSGRRHHARHRDREDRSYDRDPAP
ncbi:MAG TPA: hypothetical protein DEQ02_02460 [Ruminococcaceae bacterium]|nr:hypothetical protein [Oscillospiraceae bacterium]